MIDYDVDATGADAEKSVAADAERGAAVDAVIPTEPAEGGDVEAQAAALRQRLERSKERENSSSYEELGQEDGPVFTGLASKKASVGGEMNPYIGGAAAEVNTYIGAAAEPTGDKDKRLGLELETRKPALGNKTRSTNK